MGIPGNSISRPELGYDPMLRSDRDYADFRLFRDDPRMIELLKQSEIQAMSQQDRFGVALNQPQYDGDNPYRTYLTPTDEDTFKAWVADERIPYDPSSKADYDMRGYYKDVVLKGKDKRTRNENDGQLHFPDTYKTPYHETFSNESKYANKDTAPFWVGDRFLVSPNGTVRFDDKQRR